MLLGRALTRQRRNEHASVEAMGRLFKRIGQPVTRTAGLSGCHVLAVQRKKGSLQDAPLELTNAWFTETEANIAKFYATEAGKR